MHWMKIRGEATGYAHTSDKIIYAAIRRGELKAARIGAGRCVLTCEEWLDAWLVRQAKGQEARRP